MAVTIKFETSGAAFDGEDGPVEAGRILAKIATSIRNGDRTGSIYDINGNRQGSWDAEFDVDDEDDEIDEDMEYENLDVEDFDEDFDPEGDRS